MSLRRHHFSRSTVSVAAYCKKCEKQTQHRVSDRRLGPCIECEARLEEEMRNRAAEGVEPEQVSLFESEARCR